MKLRDEYSSLAELCGTLDISEYEIIEKLRSAGFEYSKEMNKFW